MHICLHSSVGGQSTSGPCQPLRPEDFQGTALVPGTGGFSGGPVRRYFPLHSKWQERPEWLASLRLPLATQISNLGCDKRQSLHRWLKIQSKTRSAGPTAGRCVALDWNWCVALPYVVSFEALISVSPSVHWGWSYLWGVDLELLFCGNGATNHLPETSEYLFCSRYTIKDAGIIKYDSGKSIW